MTQFNQPQGIASDPEIEATLNAMRVQISDKQAELSRQDGIITSNRYTIQQLANEKAEAQSKIKVFTDKAESLEKEVKLLDFNKNKLLSDITELTQSLDSLNKEIDSKNAKIKKEEEAINELKNLAIEARDEIERQAKELDAKDKRLNSKIAALKEIIN